MRDVQTLFIGFYALAVLAVTGMAFALRRGMTAPAWRAIRGGALGLTVGLLVAGVVMAFAFDAAFSAFHALFFSAGSWTFDPLRDRLVQLFPDQFWFETTAAVGVLAFVIAIVVARLAGARQA